MQGLLEILDIALPLGYLAVFALYVREFLRGDPDEADDSAGNSRAALYGLIAVHTTYFVLRGIELGFMPFGSKADFLSLVALSIGTVYAFIEQRQQHGQTGAFFVAPALVGQSIASVFMEYSTKHPLLLENPVYGVHVIFMVLGLTALAVGALYSVMFLLLSQQLRARELGMFFKRLPPLMKLERMSRLGTITGTALLGFGLGLGYLVGISIPDFDAFSPKIILTNVIWLGYLIGLLLSRVRGFSGVQMSWATMIWFTLFLISVGFADHSFA